MIYGQKPAEMPCLFDLKANDKKAFLFKNKEFECLTVTYYASNKSILNQTVHIIL